MDEARVLVVDDEPDILETMAAYLRKHLRGVRVDTAPDGAAALAQVGDASVLVTDLRMPGMDGMALLHAMRKEHPEVRCIMATAYPDLQIALRALNEEHVQAFLVKPIVPAELVRVVAEALDDRRLHDLEHEALETATGLVHDLLEERA